MNNFDGCNINGQIYELKVIDKLKKSGFECKKTQGYFPEYDIVAVSSHQVNNEITGHTKKNAVTFIEVKHDGKSRFSGNIFVEHRKNDGGFSGIKATINGCIYIHFFYITIDDEFVLHYLKGRKEEIVSLFDRIATIKDCPNNKEHNSYGYLVNIRDIPKKYIKRWID